MVRSCRTSASPCACACPEKRPENELRFWENLAVPSSKFTSQSLKILTPRALAAPPPTSPPWTVLAHNSSPRPPQPPASRTPPQTASRTSKPPPYPYHPPPHPFPPFYDPPSTRPNPPQDTLTLRLAMPTDTPLHKAAHNGDLNQVRDPRSNRCSRIDQEAVAYAGSSHKLAGIKPVTIGIASCLLRHDMPCYYRRRNHIRATYELTQRDEWQGFTADICADTAHTHTQLHLTPAISPSPPLHLPPPTS